MRSEENATRGEPGGVSPGVLWPGNILTPLIEIKRQTLVLRSNLLNIVGMIKRTETLTPFSVEREFKND